MERIEIEIPDHLVQEFKQYEDKLREVILLDLQQLKVQESLLF